MDSWGPHTEAFFSTDKRVCMRVDWAKKEAQLSLYRGKQKLWQITAPQEGWPPVDAFVCGSGRRVILLDQYHAMGYGKVLVVLGEQGQVLRSYTLAELISESERQHAMVSVSSIWWRNQADVYLEPNERYLIQVTQPDSYRAYELEIGKRATLSEKQWKLLRRRRLDPVRAELVAKDWKRAYRAINRIQLYKAFEFAPELIALIQKCRTHCDRGANSSGNASLLCAAAMTLVDLKGKEAQGALLSLRLGGDRYAREQLERYAYWAKQGWSAREGEQRSLKG